MNQATTNTLNAAQLRWRCRRGMLELDIILSEFFDKHYASLTTEEKQEFQLLLEQQDTTLLAWLVYQSPPPPAFLTIVQRVQRIAG